MPKKIFISCGEFSAEQHAANLVKAIQKQQPGIQIYAFGSDLLKGLGVNLIADYREYSFSGITEVISNIGKILALKNFLSSELIKLKPDLVLLVDYGGFNLELAKSIHEKSSASKVQRPRIIEFIAPQIWASRPWRINKIKKYVDKVLCTLPFEEELYKEKNIPVTYVGNPVAVSLRGSFAKAQLYKDLGIQEDPNSEILIGLFPGSRKSEIQYIYPLFEEAVNLLLARFPKRRFRFLLAKAANLDRRIFEKYSKHKSCINILDPKLIPELNHKILSASDCLWLCSGTVTLEASLYGVPHFLTYKSNLFNFILYLLFRTTTMAGLANIISQKYLVKEFLQYAANAENFVNESSAWLDDSSGSSNDYSAYYYAIKHSLNRFKESLSNKDTFNLVATECLSYSN